MRKRSVFAGACLAALVPFAPALPATETCASLYDEIRSGDQQYNVDQLKSFYSRSLATGDCTDAFKKAMGRRVAVAITREVDTAIAAGQPAASLETRLTESLTFHRLWQVLAVLGDIAQERADFISAALRYQQGLETISDLQLTRTAPAPKTIRTLFKKAETSRLLASRYVPAPKSAAGAPRGLGAVDIRGYIPGSVAVPIAFEPGTTTIMQEGQRAIADMVNQLTRQGSPDVLLIGHASTPDAQPNRQLLSEQRAHAVRQVFVKAGYRGAVQIQGRGAERPFEPDDPARYTKQQRQQMNTRVELVR